MDYFNSTNTSNETLNNYITDIEIFKIYLKEISSFPVLSRDEEVELAKRIKKEIKMLKKGW